MTITTKYASNSLVTFVTHKCFAVLFFRAVLLRRLTLLFGKAFDCVSHAVLLKKLNSYFGVQGSLLLWLTDYLTDRTHFSVVNGQHSTVLNVTCGIPQGSVLGPSLFALYTNNLLRVTSIIFSSYTVLGLGQCGLN